MNVSCDGHTTLRCAYSVLPRVLVRNQVTPAQCRNNFYNSPILFTAYNFGGATRRPAATSACASANHPFAAKMQRSTVASEEWPWATYDEARPVYKVVANIGLCRQFSSVAGKTAELAQLPAGRKTGPYLTGNAPLVTSLHTSSHSLNYPPQDFIKLSRQTLRPTTQPPVQWLPGLSTRDKEAGA